MNAFNFSALAVRERTVTLFFILAVSAVGLYAFFTLGRAEDPAFTVKVLTVSTSWPGATAQEMQDLVAEPLEKRLQELRWYDRVETVTRPGLALMTLSLKDSTPPGQVAEQFYQARKKLGDAAPQLPGGVIGPFVNDEYSDVSFALYGLESPGLSQRDLVMQAETLRQQLLHVVGVKKVSILGERPERIFVAFSYPKLATLGVDARDIFDSLTQQNMLTPAGSVDVQGPRVQIRLDGAYDSLQKIRDTPVAAAGKMLKLSDIADVTRGYEDPATFLIRHNGKPSLLLDVVMREGGNGLETGKALDAAVQKIAADLPLGMTFSKISDQSVNISAAIDEFMLKFFAALAVVMVVSLISLGWRVGIVVAAAVPLTLAAVLAIMLFTDRVFDRVTLGALIISLGLLVDDAIIVIEIMVVKLEQGYERAKAAAYAWNHTAAPMLAGTLVTVIGFVPVGFANSSAGEYAGNIFWIVGFALLISWGVAVAFTPYLGVVLLPNIAPVAGGYDALYATPRYQQFRRMVGWTVRHKFAVAGSVVVLFFLAVAGMGAVKQQFFPTSDRPEVLVEVQLPEGSSIEVTSAAMAKVEQWLEQQEEAAIVTSYIGRGAPRFFLAYNPELYNSSFAKMIILTPDAAARERLKERLRQRVAEGLVPEARVRVTQLVFGPYSPFPVSFRITGPDSDGLRKIADQVMAIMRANPYMRQVNQDWGIRQPTMHFVLDQDRLRSMGLSSGEVARQLQFLLNGVGVTQVRENIRTVDVFVRSAGPERLNPANIGDFNVIGQGGTLIPLDQIGHIEIRSEEPVMKRRDRVPTLTVQGDIDDSVQAPDVSLQIFKALGPLIETLPEGYSVTMGGTAEEAAKADGALKAVFPVMIALMLLVIMLQVRSFSVMVMVLLTAPLGLVGVVPTLLLFGQPFGFTAILGLIGLSGILMRNTLILIGQAQTNRADGLGLYDAVVEATVQRARPVILTALAAVLAFVPLTTSVFWGSMAFTLIGGTAVGTVLTLFVLPALYAIWFRVPPRTYDEASSAHTMPDSAPPSSPPSAAGEVSSL